MQPIIEGKAQIVQGSRMIGGGALSGGMPYSRYIANRINVLKIMARHLGGHYRELVAAGKGGNSVA
jgi:hypothetical protein